MYRGVAFVPAVNANDYGQDFINGARLRNCLKEY